MKFQTYGGEYETRNEKHTFFFLKSDVHTVVKYVYVYFFRIALVPRGNCTC